MAEQLASLHPINKAHDVGILNNSLLRLRINSKKPNLQIMSKCTTKVIQIIFEDLHDHILNKKEF